jgi:glucose-6-phosphate isomerase
MNAQMNPVIAPLMERPAWKALEAHFREVQPVHLRKLFDEDPQRGEKLKLEAVGLYLDYSKNRVTDRTLQLLLQLAEESGLRERRDAMFRGEKINITEKRAVLHVALRAPKGASIVVDGENVVPQVHAVLDKMAAFSNRVRSGEWKGHTGKRIRNVINIGIGGSDLGPVMAYEALKHYSERAMTFRFGLRRSGARPGRGGDFVHRFVEDFHHARDHDQRARRTRLVAKGFGRRRKSDRQTLCRGFD